MGAIAALALAIRVLHVSALSRHALFSVLLGDSKRYIEWASEIAAGDWFGSEVFYQSPLYSYALGAAFTLTGVSVDLVRILQSVGGAAACVLVAIAGRHFFDWRVGLAAGIMLAVYPSAVFFDGHVQKASLDLLLMAALITAAGTYQSSRRMRSLGAAGLALGCLILNRENARLLFPFLLMWLVFLDRGLPRARRVGAITVFALATLVPVAPVALRNYVISGELLISTSQLGPNFYIGNHAGASGVYEPLVADRGSVAFEREDATKIAAAAKGRPLSPSEISAYWVARTFDDIKHHPIGWLRLLARKTLLSVNTVEQMDTESLEFHASYSPVLRALEPFTFGMLISLAALGMAITSADVRRLTVLYGIAAVFISAVILFFVMARYRHPVVAVLMLFAGAAVVELRAAWQLRRRRAWIGVGCAALIALVVNRPLRATSEETYGNFGTELLRLDRPREAIPLLERAVQLLPNDAGVHRDLGLAYAKAGDAAGAIREYGKVVELQPQDPANHRELAVVADAAGEPQTAIVHLREAVKLDAANVSLRLRLGDLLVKADQLQDARQTYAGAMAMNSENPVDAVGVRVRIASLDIREGRRAEALALLEQAAALARSTGQTETANQIEATLKSLTAR